MKPQKHALIIGSLILIFGFQNCSKITVKDAEDSTSTILDTPNPPKDPPGGDPDAEMILRDYSKTAAVNNYRKVDVLIIIDNSGSMKYEQQNMGARTSTMLQVLAGYDWQVAITTTDPRADRVGGDGQFLPLEGFGGKKIIDSTSPIATAQQIISDTLQLPADGSGSEQPIRATSRLIQRYNANETDARAFLRPDAGFAAIVISDEDESATTTLNSGTELLKLIDSSFSAHKPFNFHSIITKPNDKVCLDGEGKRYGTKLKALSDLTGGVVGSVCEQDYGAQLSGIGAGIAGLTKTITLTCNPFVGPVPSSVKTGKMVGSIVITQNGVPYEEPYTVQGVNIVFAQELPVGTYDVSYSCLEKK